MLGEEIPSRRYAMTSSRSRHPLVWVVLLLVLGYGLWSGMSSNKMAVPVPESSRVALPGAENGTADSARQAAAVRAQYPDFLPVQAHRTIELIQRGGPYPHRQDGGTFGNFEGHLPRKPRGWYREFTVETPGLSHRGARRIVTGGDPPSAWYYTDDHYESFRPFNLRSERP